MQTSLFDLSYNNSDVVYTPVIFSKTIIDIIKPSGTILEPCKGDGAFYNLLPSHSEYCEITEGKDFFNYNKNVDWIVGNPPYSIFYQWLKHSFSLAKNVSYLLPINKVFQSNKIMSLINEYGNIKQIIVIGDGRRYCKFPFGYSVGNFHFQKNYTGNTEIILGISELNKYLGRETLHALAS